MGITRVRLETVAVILGLACSVAGAGDPPPPIFAPTSGVPYVRVMSWNVAANSFFEDPGPRGQEQSDGGRPDRFRRMLRAMEPDIVCLQEVISPRTAADVARFLDQTLPLAGPRHWQAHGRPDIVIASRFPLSMREAHTEDWGGGVPRTHAMALVDLPAATAMHDLYVVCAHAQSKGAPKDIAARQLHADAVAAHIWDLRNSGGDADLPPGTPMIVLGDWNAYRTDPALHIETLLGGEIANRERFGQGGSPDWDGSPLADAKPPHNAVGPATYTFGDGSADQFPPAALDRVLFTDSVLEMLGGFVLDTTSLDPALLSRHGMRSEDVLYRASPPLFDHLPVVVDFAVKRGAHD